MKEAIDIINNINFVLISQPLAFTDESKVIILVEDWEKIAEYIEYLQDVESHYDKVMAVVENLPVDIDELIEALEDEC